MRKLYVWYLCTVMHTASHWSLTITILWQICTVWCTKLPKHFNATVEVFYCFTVRLAWRCIQLQGRQNVSSCSAHAKQGGCRVKQQWEQGLRFWLFKPQWSSCQKIEMMQCALFYCDLWKQKLQHAAFLLPTLAPHPTELGQVFQVGCFNFAQMKASVELCINKLSAAAAKFGHILIAKSLSNLERWMVWLTHYVKWHVVLEGHRKIGKLIIPIHKKEDEWMNQLPRHLFA